MKEARFYPLRESASRVGFWVVANCSPSPLFFTGCQRSSGALQRLLHTMEVVLAGQAYWLPLGTLVGAGAAVLLASYLMIGFISKLLNPKAPPVVPCFPIVGGLIKFIKVRWGMRRRRHRRVESGAAFVG